MKPEILTDALKKAYKKEEKWLQDAEKVEKRYRVEEENKNSTAVFNALWANTEVARPELYSSSPKPIASERFRGQKLEGAHKQAAQVIEKSLEFSLDPGEDDDFDDLAEDIVFDMLVPGRAVVRVSYKPLMDVKRIDLQESLGEDGEPLVIDGNGRPITDYKSDDKGVFTEREEVVFEEAPLEQVNYKYFRIDPKKHWKDVQWVAFGDNFYTKDQATKEWGAKIAEKMSYDLQEKGKTGEKRLAQVWAVWWKPDRTVYYIQEDGETIIKKVRDPLGLINFFPTPRPLYAIRTSGSLVPIPEFKMYQDQAVEIDKLTARINGLVDAARLAGIYAGSEKDLMQKLQDADDLELIPISNFGALSEKGGLNGIIEWIPLGEVRNILAQLTLQRQDQINQMFELIGIADLQRGSTDPRETARAQNLKAQFGSRRILPKRNRLQKYIRDLLRLRAEVMSEKFSKETLSLITGIQVTDDVMQLLRNDRLRRFRIDIETDSTIAPDEEREKAAATEFLTAFGQYLNQALPLVQADPAFKKPVLDMGIWMARKFNVSREIEAELEQFAGQESPPNQEAQQQLQLEQQKADQQAQIDKQRAEAEAQEKAQQAKDQAAIKRFEAQQEQERKDAESRAEIARKERELEAELELKRQEHDQKMKLMAKESEAKIAAARAMAAAKPRSAA